MYTDEARAYHERLFPGQPLAQDDPDYEFYETFENWAYDEVVRAASALDDRLRAMCVLASCIGTGSPDEYALQLALAVGHLGLAPEDAREVAYQAVAYLGINRARPFLARTNEVLAALGVEGAREPRRTVEGEGRLAAGNGKQVEIFGEVMRGSYEQGGRFNEWSSSNCFGDYYTRLGLTLREREMITFCFLLSQGGCEQQLRGHIFGNMNVGNDAAFLTEVVEQLMPYVGYPRSANAVAAIRDVEENSFGG